MLMIQRDLRATFPSFSDADHALPIHGHNGSVLLCCKDTDVDTLPVVSEVCEAEALATVARLRHWQLCQYMSNTFKSWMLPGRIRITQTAISLASMLTWWHPKFSNTVTGPQKGQNA